ncbi:MAG: hypothetical protein WKH64_19700, partial [Chloroflexia bacterium]
MALRHNAHPANRLATAMLLCSLLLTIVATGASSTPAAAMPTDAAASAGPQTYRNPVTIRIPGTNKVAESFADPSII